MMVVAIIPARYGSGRFPGKPLADICGKPMIQWVYENAKQSQLCDRVIVATDDDRIVDVVKSFGGDVAMTDPELANGTERAAALAKEIDADIVVNIQGDEPLLQGRIVDLAIQPVIDQKFELATLCTPLKNQPDLENPHVVKVLRDDQNRAIYFSRHPIPYSRQSVNEAKLPYLCAQHVGIYVYRKETLLAVSGMPVSDLELAEGLEQLRAMKAGIGIGVFEADFESVGVDVPEDLEQVKRIIQSRLKSE